MPYIRLTGEDPIRRRRMLISGPPNHWKTTALLTMPPPRAIVSSPGEKGFATIPVDDPDTIPLIWQFPEGKRPDSTQIVREVTETCMDCLAGKYGKLNTLGFDGAHKFFDWVADAITAGAWFSGEEFEPKVYAYIYREYEDFWNRLLHTSIPVIGVTSWSGYEGDRPKRPGEKASDIPAHIWPDLPGKMARRIFGEFSVTVHAVKRHPDAKEKKLFGYPTDEEVIMWQTRPAGEVLGCGMKGPKKIVAKIPKYIPADYRVLEKLWSEAELAMTPKGETCD